MYDIALELRLNDSETLILKLWNAFIFNIIKIDIENFNS